MGLCPLGRRKKATVLWGRSRESSTRHDAEERTRQGRDRAAAIVVASAFPVSVWMQGIRCENQKWPWCRGSLRLKQQQQHGRPHTGPSIPSRVISCFGRRESALTFSHRSAFKSLFPTLGCASVRNSMGLIKQYFRLCFMIVVASWQVKSGYSTGPAQATI